MACDQCGRLWPISKDEGALLFLPIVMIQNIVSNIQKKVGYMRTSEIEDRRISRGKLLLKDGFLAETFPVYDMDINKMAIQELPDGIGELSDNFSFSFENTGVMKDGVIYTLKISSKYDDPQITLGYIMETEGGR